MSRSRHVYLKFHHEICSNDSIKGQLVMKIVLEHCLISYY